MAAEYDNIAEQYTEKDENRRAKKYSFIPTLFKLLGDVKDKSVLDLACGSGYFTRLIKEKGASEVIGVDISKEMIKLAGEKEKIKPLGIKYFVYDVLKLPKLGEFDFVAGTLLLHYSKTKKEILKMCQNIYKNLGLRGKFTALNNNPDNLVSKHKEYDCIVTAKEPLKEGDALTITLFLNGKETCSFINYYWKKETYEEAFKKVGFKNIRWQEMIVSEEGIKKFGKKFWENYSEKTHIIGISCEK